MLMKFWALQQAKREKRQYDLKAITLGHKLPRIQRQITNIQKIYQKRQTQLESQAKMDQANMKQQMNAQMAAMYGNMYGSYGMNGSYGAGLIGGMAGSIFEQLVRQGAESYNSGDNPNKVEGVDSVDPNNIWGIISGTVTGASDGMKRIAESIKTQAQQAIQQQQAMMQQCMSNMEMMIEQDKEMKLAQLEEEQEAVLLPLNEEQTETELEKTFVEARLTELKDEIETLKSECAEEAKEMAPKFGLG